MRSQICVLTSVHQPFDGRIFHRECKSLAQAGYQVTLVAPADVECQEREGVTVRAVRRPASRKGRPVVWWRLFQQVRHLRPDVVHFHDPELLLLVPLLRLALGRRVKLVYDIHEYFVDSIAVKHWIPRHVRPLVASAARRAERLLVQRIDGIVCAVEGQKPLYRYFGGPIAVVRNLPLASLFEGAEPHPALDVDGFKLIYVGLILPQRGIALLLEAMHMLRQRGVENVHLFLVGPETSPAFIQEIQMFAQTRHLVEQVHWLGYIPHEQLKHYLVNSHVGLAPVTRTRQYSQPSIATKLFEYMLAGLPIICADDPHWRVYIEESDCGLVVPAGDAAAYVDAILWLRDHVAEAAAMGQRGRAMVLDHYTWEQEASQLLAFYHLILPAGEAGEE